MATVDEAYESTFEWVFDSDVVSFSPWIRGGLDKKNPVYYVQGKPGSGKSTLMKFVMNHERFRSHLNTVNHPWLIMGFFFHDRGNNLLQKSLDGMVRHLLHCCLRADKRLFEPIEKLFRNDVVDRESHVATWSTDLIIRAFKMVIPTALLNTNVFLFLDALDEHHGDNQSLIDLIHALTRQSLMEDARHTLKMCLASRPWPIFKNAFGHCKGFEIHKYTSHDIWLYTHRRLVAASPTFQSVNEGHINRIESLTREITSKAKGVFIWVRLVLREVIDEYRNGSSMDSLLQEIESMPAELEDLYQRTIDRIHDKYKDEGILMMKLVYCSRSQLSLGQLLLCVDNTVDSSADGALTRTTADTAKPKSWPDTFSASDQNARWDDPFGIPVLEGKGIRIHQLARLMGNTALWNEIQAVADAENLRLDADTLYVSDKWEKIPIDEQAVFLEMLQGAYSFDGLAAISGFMLCAYGLPSLSLFTAWHCEQYLEPYKRVWGDDSSGARKSSEINPASSNVNLDQEVEDDDASDVV
ncbi:MAG: hypothetical protein M1828_001545 [Chrysothrix sp. TS-e1954]|nr:MAG: hypothetical protein M1828_001545 [Chrysothrix sp. TS-e1954]